MFLKSAIFVLFCINSFSTDWKMLAAVVWCMSNKISKETWKIPNFVFVIKSNSRPSTLWNFHEQKQKNDDNNKNRSNDNLANVFVPFSRKPIKFSIIVLQYALVHPTTQKFIFKVPVLSASLSSTETLQNSYVICINHLTYLHLH